MFCYIAFNYDGFNDNGMNIIANDTTKFNASYNIIHFSLSN
jgi:hypothetical protein